MLVASYIVASAAMLIAVVYLFLRLRACITTTYMLFISLLVIYGPAALVFTLTAGRPHFLISWLFYGVINPPNEIFGLIKSKIGDIDPIVVSMNFSLALMFVGIITGFEIMNRLFPARDKKEKEALAKWNAQPLQDEKSTHLPLLAIIFMLTFFMLYVSVSENHLTIIFHFFSIRDNHARDLFRLQAGGSPNYIYRTVLSALAPMFTIWGLLAGISHRSKPLVAITSVLFICTLIGDIETLSKAPPAFFLLQLILAALLTLTNRLSWKLLAIGGAAIFILIYVVTSLIVIFPNGDSPFFFVFTRLFEIENQTLLEYFATYPHILPHLWGANIRPIAWLMGTPYVPSFSTVAYTWFGTHNTTNPSLFIADAWADFSYIGVVIFSILAGAVCRSIDLLFLAKGKSVLAIAILGAAVWGILTLLTTALNTALLSGGLLLAPTLATIVTASARFCAGRIQGIDRPAAAR